MRPALHELAHYAVKVEKVLAPPESDSAPTEPRRGVGATPSCFASGTRGPRGFANVLSRMPD